MKKIIEDALNQSKAETKKSGKNKKEACKENTLSHTRAAIEVAGIDNQELEQVLRGLTTTIKVVGCGGAGTNTIMRCLAENISGAELVALNTDAQHLLMITAPHKILIGRHLTRGLGAGSLPQIGEEAAR